MREAIHKRLIHHEIPAHRSIDITALIDVVFQLLIFFMLASSLIKPNQIELDLPTSSSGVKAQETQTLVVRYTFDNDVAMIMLNDSSIEGLGGLISTMQAMKSENGDTPRVDLMIEQSVPYQQVVDLMDAVREAGFGRFSLLTMAPN